MKSARIITKTNKRSKTGPSGGHVSHASLGKKVSANSSFKKLPEKISAQAQLQSIREALAEAELIESGKIPAPSLKEALDEL
jgi:hypothetical protein